MRIEYYLPETVYSNSDMERDFPDWTAEKIESKIGIRERHIVKETETALDLAFEASKLVLQDFDPQKIDFVLLCTQSPEYFLPTGACILQDRLGLRKNIGALDFNLGCSGFIYGLALAKGMILSGTASNVLLVTSETYSKHMHPKDRANRSIFGDGAAATIVERSDAGKIHEFVLGTDGSGMNNLMVPCGGMRQPKPLPADERTDENGNVNYPNHLYMNGPEIFNFTIENIPSLVDEVIRKNNLSFEQIDYFIYHQANKYMLDYLRKKSKIPPEKYFNNMLSTGNTVSATVPIALKESLRQGTIKPGNKVLLAGFGVGYSMGAVIIEL